MPRESTVKGWKIRTSEAFRFCPKLSRLITHQMQLVNIDGALQKFFNVFEGMRERLGPVLIQLPPGLEFDKTLICNFFSLIINNYGKYRFAIEVRNRSWINDSFLDLLSQNEIAFVIADSGNRYPYYETVTSDLVYLRFHGREQLYASDYNDAVLEEYGEKIKGWLAGGKKIWVFFKPKMDLVYFTN